MAQSLRDYTDPLHSETCEEVISTCTIPLPVPVDTDFEENIIKFDGIDTTTLYVFRFQAFEQRFATPKKNLTVRKINFSNA